MTEKFRNKWGKKMQKLGIHPKSEDAKEDILRELESMNSDKQREQYLQKLINTPQAKFQRFAVWMWVIIIVVVLVVIFS